METNHITHFVFVDLENVPDIQLGLIDGHPVRITLLIGKNQKKLDLTLVQQIHRQAARVRLIEVGATGHNALDLTLAYHLGQAVEQNRRAQFCIVSKDKDFDPLIAHLNANDIKASRHESFTALPFLPQAKKNNPARPAAAPIEIRVPGDRFEKLVNRLRNKLAPRPKKKISLLARINSDYGNKLDETGKNAILEKLVSGGVIAIGANGTVTYL